MEEKITIRHPQKIGKADIKKIAKEIREKKINWTWEESENFWLITIAPNGKIILPTKETPGHPEMATQLIYPNDPLLQYLFEYFSEEKNNGQKKSSFMIEYGYINIDGYGNGETIEKIFYNPLTFTVYTETIINSLKREYGDINFYSNIDIEKSADVEYLRYVLKVSYVKKQIIDILKKYNIGNDENLEANLEKITKKSKKDFIIELEKEYYDIEKKMFQIIKITTPFELEYVDLFRSLQEKIPNLNVYNFFDQIESYDLNQR